MSYTSTIYHAKAPNFKSQMQGEQIQWVSEGLSSKGEGLELASKGATSKSSPAEFWFILSQWDVKIKDPGETTENKNALTTCLHSEK